MIDVIYCDFRKAFDTVPHNRFMNVLEHYGVTDPILSWVKDFLSNRTQQIVVNDRKSETHHVTSGVPQGSVLGPLLFVTYINLMVDKAGSLEIYLYADDLKIYNEIKSSDDVEDLQNGLDNLFVWTEYSLLRFHPGKCVTMRLMPRQTNTQLFSNIDETKLRTVNSEQDLGLLIDNELTFKEHIHLKVKKANALFGMLRRTFVHLDKEMFKQLFVAIVIPHLEYGAAVWNPYKKELIRLIENVQRRASRQVEGISHLPYNRRLEEMKLPTLQYRRFRGDMIEVYKLSHGLYDEEVTVIVLTFRDNTRHYFFRGHRFNLPKGRYRKDLRKFSFRCHVTERWNNLPESIVHAENLNTFKNRFDRYWEREGVLYGSDIYIYIRANKNSVEN